MKTTTIMLIDGNSIINRAFYGLRPMNAPDGTPTHAVYGFLRILAKLRAERKPDALLVAFDTSAPTFRHGLADTYKATRRAMPDDLAAQVPILKDVLDAMNIARAEAPGWEADDILGTMARRAEGLGQNADIVTGDRDALQLVSGKTRVLLVRSKQGNTETLEYTPEKFEDEYGFAPVRHVDLKALMGDSSDNIKGVAGIGEKTALELMRAFGSLDAIYENIEAAEIRAAVRKKLEAGRGDAELSRTLATIRTDAPLDTAPDDTMIREPDSAKLYEIFARLGFKSLIAEMGLEQGAGDFAPLEMPEGADPAKIGSNIKDEMRRGVDADWEFDVSLAAYLLNPTQRGYVLADLAPQYLGRQIAEHETPAALANLRVILGKKLREDGMERLYFDVELPLCRVLADMEEAGVLIDRDALIEYGDMLAGRITGAEAAVHALAGEEFNINSPKQLGVILFEKLNLPAPKRTKTGYSTGIEVLDKLEYLHPVITAIKEYRELTKLKATYADGLLRVIADDGRIHTSFQMTATATGRLSSTEPNLQNIPIRRELGERLRTMFIAPEGSLLIDADYSQIELRLLAHIAGDSAMLDAFRSGEDIHAVTASRVFGVPLELVSPQMRSRAKAVNFGMVYGISAFSLAKDIGVSVAEAREYMESYFERFSGVRAYMTDIIERAKADKYVATLFGRRRYLPELAASDFNTRSFGERVALNMPIQGTAADIMKIAMVRAHRRLRGEVLGAKLILQVHDELIAEAPEEAAEMVKRILVEEMENAAQLDVPLKADAGVGRSWDECK